RAGARPGALDGDLRACRAVGRSGGSTRPSVPRQDSPMAIRLYSTLERGFIELAEPPARIGIYVCGPTVYARAHIGNARPFIVFSWLRNWLRDRGYEVALVQNITDINDKIYDAAPGRSAELADRATRWYIEDTD